MVTDGQRVAGTYALAAGAINVTAAPGRFRRNMPNPTPVALLGCLAVDRSQQGKGLGRALFRDGAKRIINAADTLGIQGLIVHAISEQARAFYIALGFDPSPLEPMILRGHPRRFEKLALIAIEEFCNDQEVNEETDLVVF